MKSLCFYEIQNRQHQQDAICAYKEALDLGCIADCIGKCPQNVTTTVLRIINTKTLPSVGNLSMLRENLQDIYALRNRAARMDENWYLLFQVVRIVHGFATKCVCWDIEGENSSEKIYSLDRLCTKVGVHVKDAEKMLKENMFERGLSNKSKTKRKKITQNKPQKKPRNLTNIPMYLKSDGSLPEGWTIEAKKRNNSQHVDRYWYSKTQKKLRSRIEVKIFLEKLKDTNDEDLAYELLYEEKEKMKEKKRLEKQKWDY